MKASRLGMAAGALFALALFALGDKALAQCECYEDGCFDVGKCGYPGLYGFESWCRCNGGTPGWRDCTAEEQANQPPGVQCVSAPACYGLPQSCGDSGSYDSGQSQEQTYTPPPNAEEMQRAQDLYAAGQQNARPPVISPYTAAAPVTAPVPVATGVTSIKTIASKVPPLPSSKQMDYGPMLDPSEPSAKTPALSDKVKKLIAMVREKVKEKILALGDEIISESEVGGYYKVAKTGWWAKEKAIEAMDKFMDLARRGFPEKETRDFVDNQEKRYAWDYFGPAIDLPPDGGNNNE